MVKSLLTSRRIAPLFWTQFLAALNDNSLKQSLVLLCLFKIVAIDAKGFITIKGRTKRFAKFAGEMVSLISVEAIACAAWPAAEHVVVAVPDGRKGERLALLTTEPRADYETLLRQARRRRDRTQRALAHPAYREAAVVGFRQVRFRRRGGARSRLAGHDLGRGLKRRDGGGCAD